MNEKFYRIAYKLDKDIDLNKHWLFEGKKQGYFSNPEDFYKKFSNINFSNSNPNPDNKSRTQEYLKIRHFLKVHSNKLEYQPYYNKIFFDYLNSNSLETIISNYNASLLNNLILVDFDSKNSLHIKIVKQLKKINESKFNTKFIIKQLLKNDLDSFNLCKYFINLKDKINLNYLIEFYNLNITVFSISPSPNKKFSDYLIEFKLTDTLEKTLEILEQTKSFDIVVPCFNTEKYIENTLKSIFSQTYRKFNVYLIDDKSTDSTLEVLNKYNQIPNVNIISNKTNLGKYMSINSIIDNLKSDYFLMLDSDDIIIKTRLIYDLIAFEQNESILLVQSQYYRYNEITKNIIFEPAYGENIITFKRKIFGLVGKFFNTRFGGDTEFLERIIKFLGEDEIFYQLPKITYIAIIRKDESNLTKTIDKDKRIKFVKKYRKLHELNNVNFFIKLF
jgi:hypothetical protein